jgi:hypothetical protein
VERPVNDQEEDQQPRHAIVGLQMSRSRALRVLAPICMGDAQNMRASRELRADRRVPAPRACYRTTRWTAESSNRADGTFP